MLPALLLVLTSMLVDPSSTSRDVSIAGRQPRLATDGRSVGLVVGRDDAVYFARSDDGGRTFGEPVKVSGTGHLALGLRRGPRLVMVPGAIVITAVMGERGKGADGDLVAWRSTDGGRTWSAALRVNDVEGSAREGMQALGSNGSKVIAAAWLDLRKKGTRVYAAVSRDAGRSWSANLLVYESPTGSVCECCHPSVAVSPSGEVAVMFRNQIAASAGANAKSNEAALPARDMYLARSRDGRTFAPAVKLGSGTWPLAACPMDGGDLAFDGDGSPITVWRRAEDLYLARVGAAEEQRLGSGVDPVLAVTPRGIYSAWFGEEGLVVRDAGQRTVATIERARWPSLLPLADGRLLVAWEQDGMTFVRPL
jgi:hypothetical protein